MCRKNRSNLFLGPRTTVQQIIDVLSVKSKYHNKYYGDYNVSTFRILAQNCRGFVSRLGGLKESKMFLPHPLVKLCIVGSLRDQEVACSASALQGLNFESCVWRAVSSHSFNHPHEVLLAQFSLYMHNIC